jgi:hypothetical protein
MSNSTFKQWLAEMPISNAELVGKWDKWPQDQKQHQLYDKASYNILTNDPNFEKLKGRFSKTKQNFDIYFVKKGGMSRHHEVGEVSEDYLDQLGIDLPPINGSNITLLFTNNRAAERMPLTPWTTAHRMGHAFRRLPEYDKFYRAIEREFDELIDEIYGLKKPSQWGDPKGKKQQDYARFMRQLMQAFGSMRSAREGELFREGEFVHELLAQYIINGKITFREEIPRQLVTKYAWGNPTWDGSKSSKIHNDEYMMDYVVEKLRAAASYFGILCERMLDACVGKIFVM